MEGRNFSEIEKPNKLGVIIDIVTLGNLVTNFFKNKGKMY